MLYKTLTEAIETNNYKNINNILQEVNRKEPDFIKAITGKTINLAHHYTMLYVTVIYKSPNYF